jgi:hypothetical protein
VSPDRVRAWIRRGELPAVNTAATLCGRPRFVITPEALQQFERGRQAATTPPKSTPRKPLKALVDFYPD